MITTPISKSLIVELRESFRTDLPTEAELIAGTTLQQLAYKAGYKACVDYIEACYKLQEKDDNLINIQKWRRFIICFGSNNPPKVEAAKAPPAPEPTPQEIITPEETTAQANERKQSKGKATGVGQYRATDLNIPGSDEGSGLNVPKV